jgi:S1-C subfamily serine protease
MERGPLGAGAGKVRRLGKHCAAALALAAAALPAAPSAAGGPAAAPGAAEESRPHPGALAFHAIVVNGPVTGSAFALADGLAVTNAHVLVDRRPGARVALTASIGGARATGTVLAVSPRMDLALVAVPRGFLPVVSGRDAPAAPGRRLTAAGVVAGPRGPGPTLELDGAVASGVFTLPPYGPGLVAAMPGVRRGFSGGPVLDEAGRLVGMIAALRPAPGGATSATGAPLTGTEAFVLSAPALRAEAARLLAARR